MKVWKDTETLRAGIYTFKNKYNCYPGDCPNATDFFGADASCPSTPYNTNPKTATCNGNNDGRIGDYDSAAGSTIWARRYEWYRFFQHLANAGLIKGQYSGTAGTGSDYDCRLTVNCMAAAVDEARYRVMYYDFPVGNSFSFPMSAGNYVFVATAASVEPVSGQVGNLMGGAMTPVDALALDSKFDDGLPGTGRIISATAGSPYAPGCTDGSNPATTRYLTTDGAKTCPLMMRISDGSL